MISSREIVKCKSCGEEGSYDVSSGVLYKVNEREDVEYIGIKCKMCGEENLLALGVVVTDSYSKMDVENAVNKRSKEMIGYLGNKEEIEKIKNIVRKREVFMTEDERVLLKEDVGVLEEMGVYM